MTRNYYTTGNYKTVNYKPNHSTCGSVIYNYDFDGYVSITSMAERIISDLKFDKKCKKNAKNRDENKKIARKELTKNGKVNI